MALKRNEYYPGRFNNPTSEYPQGAFRNRTAPGAKDGSFCEQEWARDWDGFFARLLTLAEMTPDGVADTGLKSQYMDALLNVTSGRLLNVVDFTSSGIYKPSDAVRFIIVEVTGGGGGGGGSVITNTTSVSVGGGGGGGGTSISKLKISDITSTIPVTVGSAGNGGSSSAIATSGGDSSFGSYMTARGGQYGPAGRLTAVGSSSITYNGAGGLTNGGNLDNRRGGHGGVGIVCQSNYSSGVGGSSYCDSGGYPIAGQGNASPGASGSRGSGGSGGVSVVSTPNVMNGGAGGAGFVRIWEYA